MSSTILGRVLVVDDEFQLMDALVEALNAQGYEAHGFTTGLDAIATLQNQEFDLLLTDLMMPGMDGITLLKACMAIDENLMGIIMTGQGTVSTAVEAMKVGAFDYVLKPFRLDAVLPMLARAREVRQLRLENIQLRETVAIYDLSQTLAISLDSKLILDKTAEAARQQSGADEVSIMLLTPDKREFIIAAVRDKDRGHLLGQRIPLKEGIAGWVAQHSEALILNGKVLDPRFKPSHPRDEIYSAISMPMLAAGEIVGVLNINSLKPRRPFTPGQIKALSVLSSSAAAALENETREKRFRAIIEHAPDGIALLGLDGKLRQVTPSTEYILGYGIEEAQSQDPSLLTHPEDLPTLLSQINDLIQDPGKVIRTEYRFKHKDGSWRWLESTVSNLIAEPSVGALVFNYHDITERKRTEEQLRYDAYLLSNVNDAIIASDENYRITYWNRASEALYGWSAEETFGKFGPDITKTEFPNEDGDEMLRYIRDSGLWRGEVTQVKKDGTRFPCEISSLLLRDEKGGVTGYVSINRDITERKQTEEALRDSETRYRTLFESNPHPMWVYDVQTLQFLAVNDAAIEHYGYSLEEFLSMTIKDIRPNEDIPALMSNVEEFQQDLHRPTFWRHRKKDGTLIDVEITSHSLQWEECRARLVLVNDITERKRAQESLQEKERLLSEAQRIGHVGSWSYNIETDTLQFSDEMYRLFDIPSDKFVHNSDGFLHLIYSLDIPLWVEWMKDIRAGRATSELEFRVFRNNGELRYIRCRGALKFDKVDKPIHFIATAQDVTERKLAEIQIRQQIEHLKALRNIDQAISSSFNLNVTLDVLISEVISQLQVDAADVLLLNGPLDTLTYASGQGFRIANFDKVELPVEGSHSGLVVKQRRLLNIPDLRARPAHIARQDLLVQEGFTHYFGVPLITKGKVNGVLELFHRVELQPYPEWVDFLNTLAGQAAIAIDNASLFESLQRSNEELFQAYDATIEGWSRALDLRDKETEGHTQRVTEMTLKLARAFGMSEEDIAHIRRGALLHDIGKMGVPDHILLKPGELMAEEWDRMKSHPEYAYQLLKPIAFLAPALDIPYCHHEKWDGTGYPRGLRGEQIPLEARLFAVVDVWDAITSDRPYRKAWSAEKAVEYIRGQSGTHFDPAVVKLFLEILGGV